ncbi:MAG TPA: CheR family methyltransferase [Anaeromyxobacteraceae bacterium]|nr:CheR family methyltransferase [Anaeromyxobacteraceae bacterium]
MSASLARALPMSELEGILERACGLAFAKGAARCLADGFAKAARDAGADAETFLARLLAGDEACVTALVENAVVGETYFFRHPEHFEALRRTFGTAPLDRPLSIWSAGCATGEEPYSIAMSLLDAGRDACPDRILASDVSARAIRAAGAGLYGPWSLRRIEPALRARHFEGRPPRETVVRAVRERVRFLRHNLVRDPPPVADADLVVCRNVLIYFRPPVAERVVAKLFSAIRPGGILLLGPVETPLGQGLEAERIDLGAATLFRRLLPGERPVARGRHAPRPAARRRQALRTDRAAPARKVRSTPPPQRKPAAAQGSDRRGEAASPGAHRAEPPASPSSFERAREAARRGDHAEAERIARESAARDLSPECYLLLSMSAEFRGDLEDAVEAARRALYLEPDLAMAHASLVALFRRLGRPEEAARARRNALRAIEGRPDEALLRGVEPITAGALRAALAVPEGIESAARGSYA